MRTLATGMPTPTIASDNAPMWVILAVTIISVILTIALTLRICVIEKTSDDGRITKNENKIEDTAIVFTIVSIIMTLMTIIMLCNNVTKPFVDVSKVEQHYNISLMQSKDSCDNDTMVDRDKPTRTQVQFNDANGDSHKGILAISGDRTSLWVASKTQGYVEYQPTTKAPKVEAGVQVRGHETQKAIFLTLLYMAMAAYLTNGVVMLFIDRKHDVPHLTSIQVSLWTTAIAALLIGSITLLVGDMNNAPQIHQVENHYNVSGISITKISSDDDCDKNCNPVIPVKGMPVKIKDSDYTSNFKNQVNQVSFTGTDGKPCIGVLQGLSGRAVLYVQQGNKLVEYKQ